MPRDIEAELRRSLEARAADVTPDPALYARVQSRIRRGRTFRLALAGVAGALAVAGIAVAAPAVINNRVEFEPAPPVATQPAPEPTATSIPEVRAPASFVFTDGATAALPGSVENTLLTAPAEHALRWVATRPGSTLRNVALAGIAEANGCGEVVFENADSASSTTSTGTAVPVQSGCAATPVFSPDGGHLAWVASGPDGWQVQTVDWSGDGPGDGDASFGLPWPADQPVDLQEWVWDSDAGTAASGHLVLRTQRNGAWMLVALPIERQADGALAVTGDAGLLAGTSGSGADFSPLAFASGGPGVTYTLEAQLAPDGPQQPQVVRRLDGAVEEIVELPDELVSAPDFDFAFLWLSGSPDTALVGYAATQSAWTVDWSGSLAAPEAVAATVIHADLLTPRVRAASEPPEPRTQSQVDVFFGMEGADACVASSPVVREVEGAGVARAALTELLAGPTPQESNSGIVSPFTANTAGALNDIVIVDGQAQVDFADFSADVGNDSCTKSTIIDALDSTLLQFPTVTSTRYSFDGDVDAFESWLGRSSEAGEPPAAVTDKHAQILAAARARDYDALEPLMREGFACAFSDQPEPCVPIWKEQERNGEDPLGTLVEILESEPIRNPDAPIWIWPSEWADRNYLGPRTGIDEGGTWLYYQQGGD